MSAAKRKAEISSSKNDSPARSTSQTADWRVLAAQLRHRVLSGDGEATYVVGVTDDGGLAGISPAEFSESMDVLSLLAEEAGAHIEEVKTWGVDGVSENGSTDTDGIVGVALSQRRVGLETSDHAGR